MQTNSSEHQASSQAGSTSSQTPADRQKQEASVHPTSSQATISSQATSQQQQAHEQAATAASSQQPLIRMYEVTKRYFLTRALGKVSLDIPNGGIIGVIGPNGSGKSTLLRLAAGLLRSTTGEALINGRIADRMSNRLVSFVSDRDTAYGFYSGEN